MKVEEIVNEIRNLKEENVEEWINNRLEFLEITATEDRKNLNPLAAMKKRIDNEGIGDVNTEINGFIKPETQISKNFYSTGFVLDDKSFYTTITMALKQAEQSLSKNNSYIMHMIQITINKYFGVTGTEERRTQVYDNNVELDEDGFPSRKPFSISKFRQNYSGLCSERTAVAQNILSFLGYDAMMIYGNVLAEHSNKNEAHAYNCIMLPSGNGMLVDFSNPIFKDGIYYRPSIHRVDSDTMKKFIHGKGEIEVSHKAIRTIEGKEENEIEQWVYSSEEIDKKYFENKKREENLEVITVVTPSAIGKKTIDATIGDKNNAEKTEQDEKKVEITNNKQVKE